MAQAFPIQIPCYPNATLAIKEAKVKYTFEEKIIIDEEIGGTRVDTLYKVIEEDLPSQVTEQGNTALHIFLMRYAAY